jgi:hypothetical protein
MISKIICTDRCILFTRSQVCTIRSPAGCLPRRTCRGSRRSGPGASRRPATCRGPKPRTRAGRSGPTGSFTGRTRTRRGWTGLRQGHDRVRQDRRAVGPHLVRAARAARPAEREELRRVVDRVRLAGRGGDRADRVGGCRRRALANSAGAAGATAGLAIGILWDKGPRGNNVAAPGCYSYRGLHDVLAQQYRSRIVAPAAVRDAEHIPVRGGFRVGRENGQTEAARRGQDPGRRLLVSQGCSSAARTAVSKAACRGFESLRPCEPLVQA